MAFKADRSWTLPGLITAFVDLAVAYILLCYAAYVFFLSKLLSVFGLFLPCPCRGILGYQNSDLCWHKLLIDWPTRKIYCVQALVKSRFPFDLILCKNGSCNSHAEVARDGRYGNGDIELEGEACSSSFSSPRLQNIVDRESGHDAKGKAVSTQTQKSGIRRRRRRAAFVYGKVSSVLSSNRTCLVGIGAPHPPYDGSEMRSEISENLGAVSGIEDGLLDDGNAPPCIGFGERIQHSFELSGSYGTCKGVDNDSSSVEKFTCNAEDRPDSAGNDAYTIRNLEQALEEEKTARVTLYQELEKERAAAATAADEAMAMIMRLQEDKASIEMESRQCQRMIEEKFVYDEEEMNILKEILVRRERENHFLQKEIEAYRQMSFSGNELLECDLSHKIDSSSQKPALSIDSNENPLLMMHQIENSKSIGEKEVATSPNWFSDHKHSHTIAFGKEMMSKHEVLTPDLLTSQAQMGHQITSQGLLQKTVNLAGKEQSQRGFVMMPRAMEVSKTCGGIGEKLEKDRGHWNLPGSDTQVPVLNTESTVYDVHVVDDNGGKESGPLSGASADSAIWSGQVLSDCPSTSISEIEPNVHGSSFGMSGRLPVSGDLQCKTLVIDSLSNASSSERLKIDTKVEGLRERLRIVQEEKEKLTFSTEHMERINAQLKLVEEIVNQLREIQLLRETPRQASLPPSSARVSLKKRRCQSVPL